MVKFEETKEGGFLYHNVADNTVKNPRRVGITNDGVVKVDDRTVDIDPKIALLIAVAVSGGSYELNEALYQLAEKERKV